MSRVSRLAAWLGVEACSARARGVGRRRARFLLERLERREVPATLVVQTIGDATGPVTANSDGTLNAPTFRAAVDYANANAGADTITFSSKIAGQVIGVSSNDTVLPANYAGPTGFVITDSLGIVGDAQRGSVLDGLSERRILAVASGVTLNLANMTLLNGKAIGGAGGDGFAGGGGGAGMGGAIYARNATINMDACMLTGNIALGGNGGDGKNGLDAGGGGGTVAFAGGAGSSNGGGGGGAGTNGPGSDGNGNVGGAGGANPSGVSAPARQKGTSGGGGGGGTSGSLVSYSGGPASGMNVAGLGGGGGGGTQGTALAGDAKGGAGGFGAGGGGGGVSRGVGGAGGFGGGGGGSSAAQAGVSPTAGGGGAGGDGDGGTGGGGGGAGLGGAIFLYGGKLNLANTTLVSNGALGGLGGTAKVSGVNGQGFGGAIFAIGKNTVTTTNSTITNNVSDSGQIVVITLTGSARSTSLTLRNTVVAGTGASGGPDVIARGLKGARPATIRGFHNFVGRPGKLPRSIVVGQGDPRLGPLADNGGPTLTLLPRADSPLIDAGRRPRKGLAATDQRGLPRLVGDRVDIGAVEVS